MIKGILFDKDGTLIEFESVWHDIFERVFCELESEYHLSKQLVNGLMKISGYLENEFERESIIQHCATSEIAEIWINYIKHESDNNCEGITVQSFIDLINSKAQDEDITINALEGVKELLTYLKSKGYIVGVATGDTKVSTMHCMKKADIVQYFDYFGCNEEGVMPKPSSDMAIRFCQQYKINPDELLIVGDSLTDMNFAENAKAEFVGIKTQYNQYEEFEKRNKLTVEKIIDIIKLYEL